MHIGSVVCGPGIQMRKRTCLNGSCEGNDTEIKACLKESCHCKFYLFLSLFRKNLLNKLQKLRTGQNGQTGAYARLTAIRASLA